MTRERIVVLGADAAGMSAAHQALRMAKQVGREIEVIALEKTVHTSYSACGIPYWVSGEVESSDELIARSPERHREMGVDLITGALATGIDRDAGVAHYSHDGVDKSVGYDQLVIATGASPIVPDWALRPNGQLVGGVAPAKTLVDGQQWIDLLVAAAGAESPRRVVVAGGGYIGVEMAEAARARGLEVTLLTRSAVMSSLDVDMSSRVEKQLAEAGVQVVGGAQVVGLEVDHRGWVTSVETVDGDVHRCDLLVLATGVLPATEFAVGAGLETGQWGGLRAQPDGSVASGIWAAGDCCEVRHRLTGDWTFSPLGTHANKQGRIVGTNLITPGSRSFGGVLGTAITRYVHGDTHLEISRTGLSTREAQAAGLRVSSMVTEGRTASGYMTEAAPVAVKVFADPDTRALAGAQIVGGRAAAKRIDTVAAALWSGASIDDLAEADLAYAPPFATVWEIVQLAARRLADSL
ncbi:MULTISPECIES: FAD-dependent oxidoreductase [unclassified Nocardioides]|uniref:FAD-dependent oxidoreductase n=1 Tax=unclassified Nocardioides TaxID=2615069 RepID=UPI0006FD9E68|nr:MULTISPECIES: FAD-dependent oxidoreductase [unclassified Nocardioides]KRA29987.1 CoA-disulfide reductase [Nocardioides sp. Root614]KRA86908.1 CoA-disulfide reductase [Nocardioides sp. Root682]